MIYRDDVTEYEASLLLCLPADASNFSRQFVQDMVSNQFAENRAGVLYLTDRGEKAMRQAQLTARN